MSDDLEAIVSGPEGFTHGAQPDDPVPNESDCCFGCDYHNCMISNCPVCEEMILWDWRNLDPPKWAHIDRPIDGHDHQDPPPEHWAWIVANRVHVFDGTGGDE